METQNNGKNLAIIAMVSGIFGFVLSCFIIGIIPSIIGLIVSIICLKKHSEGSGMAIAGLITSILGLVISGFLLLSVPSFLNSYSDTVNKVITYDESGQ